MSKSSDSVIINVDDTNALVLLLYWHSQDSLPDLVYIHTGKQNNMERFIAVQAIMEQIGQDVCNALPAAYGLQRHIYLLQNW